VKLVTVWTFLFYTLMHLSFANMLNY
jgi:hypothetical protein